jgi:hypothetical protein
MSSKRLLPLLSLLLLVSAAACDKASPVAPTGTTLTLSANPTKIGLNGESTITVVGRKPDGNPLNPGTEIRLSTDKGTISPIVEVGAGGAATTTFRADGRTGAAVITATTGAGDVTAMATLQIGETDETRPTLLVSVSPSNIPVEGTATVTVIARNADGSLVEAGREVILTSTLGSLSPSRPVTRADGTAVSTLRAGNQGGTAEVTAILGSSAPATATVTIRDAATDIALQASRPSIPASGGTITFIAFVANAQGQPLQGAPVTFESTDGVGTFETTGVVTTDATGQASNVLTVAQEDLAGRTSFTVRARTPSGTGQLLVADPVTIRVN